MYATRMSFNWILALALVLGLLFTAAPGTVMAITGDVPATLQAGADRLTVLQNTDGGWDWPLDDGNPASDSPKNTVGPIAKGLAMAYLHTNDADHLAALLDAGTLLLTKTNNFSPPDGYLAAQLDEIFGGTTYSSYIKANFYDLLAAGTYYRAGVSNPYSTATYVALLLSVRGQLAGWDLGMGLVGASAVGASTTEWIDAVKTAINGFNGTDDYSVLSLAGAIYGLAYVNEDFDPTAGAYASASNLSDLANILLGYQVNNGSFVYNPTADLLVANESLQNTAYAILGLNELNRAAYLTNITGAADYLAANQLGTGGWIDRPGDPENNEGTGESLWAISVAYPKELWVCPAGDCGHPGAFANTIQDAVNTVYPGGTINVAAGTYTEVGQIVINKNLTIVGADKTTTIIKPANDTGSTGDAGSFILVNDSVTLNLSSVTIDGVGRNIRQALRFNGSGSVDNVTIQNITYPTYFGWAIAQGYTNTTARTLSVTNSTFTNFGRVGIQTDNGTGTSTVTISNNDFTCKGVGTNHLDYGIYVEGGSDVTITGNTITDCLGTVDPWGSAAIAVGTYFAGGTTATITGNTLTNNTTGIEVGYDENDTSSVVAEENQIIGNEYAITTTAPAVDASPNWFGSITGPAAGSIFGNVTYAPWCADAGCTTFLPDADSNIIIPGGTSGSDIQALIKNAPEGTTLLINPPSSSAPGSQGFVITTPHLTIVLANGTKIQNNSPCFTVEASHVTITTETIGTATCVPTNGSSSIVVNAGLTDVTITGLEIDGSDATGSNHGIEFLGASSYVRILNNIIHDMDQTGVFFFSTPTGTVDIQGNLFQNNTGVGISNLGSGATSIVADYNSWGDIAGPAGTAGDGVSLNVTVAEWTHVDLSLVSSGTPWANQVVTGKNITYTVKANLENVTGAVFTLTYNPAVLDLVSGPTAASGSSFTAAGPDLFVVDEIAGTITFNGEAAVPVSGAAYALFDVTFNGIGAAGATNLAFDSTNDLFAMAPPAGSSNNVYAAALAGETVTLVAPPTVSSGDFGGNFSVGYPRTFSLTVTNPSPSVIYPALELRISLPTDATLKVWNGTAFVSVTCTAGVCTVPVTLVDGVKTVEFEVTFNTAGTPAISAALYETTTEPDWLLHTLAGTTTVNANYTVTGMVTMQGRIFRGGVPALLTKLDLTVYGPFPTSSVDTAPDNLVWSNMPVGQYKFTTNQPRYLNVTSDLNKTFTLAAARTLATLQLKGGNAVWSDNEINISDAGLVGGNYGALFFEPEANPDADVNFDGKVNIFDLALVGGNYTLTSGTAYASWTP